MGGNTGYYKVSGVEGTGYYDGLTVRLRKKFDGEELTADEILPVGSAVSILEFPETEETRSGCVMNKLTGLRTLAFPFSLEHVKTTAELESLLIPVFDFLMDHPAQPEFSLTLNKTEYTPTDPFLLEALFLSPYSGMMNGMYIFFWRSWVNTGSGHHGFTAVKVWTTKPLKLRSLQPGTR